MSAHVRDLARDYCKSKRIAGTDRALFLELAEHASTDGICWPYQDTLAELVGRETDTVRRRLAFLKRAGMIEVRKAHRPQVRRGRKRQERFNVYRLVCLEGLSPPNTERLAQHGIILEEPFTTGTKSRSSETDDRDPDPGTTGTQIPVVEGGPLYREVLKEPKEERGAHLQLIEGNGEVVEPSEVISAYFEQQAKARGAPPPDRTVATVEKLSDELLGKGYTERDIRRGIDRMLDKGLGAQLLDRLVFEAKVSGRSRGLTPAEIAAMGDEEMGGAMSARPSGRREGS